MLLQKKVFGSRQPRHLVKWLPDTDDWVTLNVGWAVSSRFCYDGAQTWCRVGCEGIVMNKCGGWMKGFSKFLGACNS